MENQYYYLRMNKPVGPVTMNELKTAFKDEVINDATNVCVVGEDQWRSLNQQPFYPEIAQMQKLSLKPRKLAEPPAPAVPLTHAMDSTTTHAPMGQAAYNPNLPDPNATNFNPTMSPEEALRQSQEIDESINFPSLATSWKMQLGLGVFVLGVGASILSFTFAAHTGRMFYTAYIGLIGFGVITFYKGYCGE